MTAIGASAGRPGSPESRACTDVIDHLRLPGIADLHVHFMPPRVMAAVWRYFESAGPLVGRDWPIRYRGSDAERVALLRSFGVELFAGLTYAHKPAMAQFLTEWSLGFAAGVRGAVATGTFFPEPGVRDYVVTAVERGCRLFKIHLQVGDFDPRDPLLDDVWGELADIGVPVVVHAGSGPMPGRFTGPGPIAQVLARHPRLSLIFAHFGMPEEVEFVSLAQQFPNCGLDTTMVETDFMREMHVLDAAVLPAIRDLGVAGRVFFGSDFPNIPYRYDHQVDVLERWELGDDWLAAVLWGNAARQFGVSVSSAEL